MRALAEALRFLTVIPVPGRPPRKNSAVFAAYPWAGLVIGILCAAAAFGASKLLAAAGAAVVAVVVRIAVTGGLHMDGLADLADGLGGGRDTERRLAIMADSRLGSFGALALLCMFALQVTFTAGILGHAGSMETVRLAPLVLAPVISRGVIPFIIAAFPSARAGGMGDRSRQAMSRWSLWICGISVPVIGYLLAGALGLIVTAAVAGLVFLIALRISRRLGGLTGDVYGALMEIGDAAVLLCVLVFLRLEILPACPLY